MGLIIDTCVFIQAERKNHGIDFSKWLDYGNAYITAITASELLVGIYRADTEQRRVKRTAFVEAILANCPTLNFTLETARIHAEISSYLKKQNQQIGAHDLMIAAIALTHDYVLLTNNLDEFNRIPGLKLLSC